KPKTTVIYPEDTSDQDTGYYDTLMPVIGKTTVGKTTVKTIETKSVPQPTVAPIKVAVPTIHKAPVGQEESAATTTPTTAAGGTPVSSSAGGGGVRGAPNGSLQSTPAVDAGGGCCVIS
ncbi:MAG: hypothetical protein SGILL_007823, partial [Bacillariaceae sp.]